MDVTIWRDAFHYILEYGKDQYYKFPLMMLIHHLKTNEDLRGKLTFDQFKRIVSNYYVYAYSFINRTGSKDKKQINRPIFELLLQPVVDPGDIVREVKKLRQDNIRLFAGIPEKFNKDQFNVLYSIIDHFDAQDNSLDYLYNDRNGYNNEHLIIHNDKNQTVVWKNGEDKMDEMPIKMKDFPAIEGLKRLKEDSANHIIIPKDLNENYLKSYDIVTKIEIIERYFGDKIPVHIETFLGHIKAFEEYQQLMELKKDSLMNPRTKDKIQERYIAFTNAYFDEMNKKRLRDKLKIVLEERLGKTMKR